MPTYTEPKYLSDVLLVEVAAGWTKQNGVLAAITETTAMGTVLSKDANGILQPIDFTATDGTENAVGVLATNADINPSQQKTVFIARGATVAKNQLVWPEGATDEQIATALAELEALGIVAQNTY
ncbi:head decoration protein [Acinetobacter ursingii]|uniref:head decoration protein n=1 Tax=Acinetobacter ursingii TaxID=108980 RepID=UPI0021CD4184|nr:head decoration protein [Acinetobacter ursingii]MCU4601865.1 head decoration protein [Acinetobacter ursingii]